METVFFYFIKMMACSAIMFAYYLLFLRDKTFHHYNRFYLLTTVLISLFLPLLKIEYFTIETDSRILLLLDQWDNTGVTKETSFWNFQKVVFLTISIVSALLLLKIMFGIFKIRQMEKKYPKETLEGITFYNTNLEEAPFSFFKSLFWKDSILIHSDLGKQILKHEMVHIEQKHSIDKLLIQLVQSVFWFNPVFYFIKKEINLIHEYLADKKALQNSDTKAFAQMLLASKFSGDFLPAANPFLSSNLKKRLQMLTMKTTKYSYTRRILALPILFMVSFALLVNAKNKEILKQNKEIAVAVQQIKKDTLKKENMEATIQKHQEKLNKATEKLKKDNEKIKLLSEESRKKADELKSIAQSKGASSYEFELKTKELENLSKEIDRITQSDDFKKRMKDLDIRVADFEKVFDSDDFKRKFKFDNEKVFRFEFEDAPSTFNTEVRSPRPPRLSEKEEAERLSKLTPEQQKELKKIMKERKALAEKQAEYAKKQAELAKKEAEITGEKVRKFFGREEIIDLPNADRIRNLSKAPKIYMYKSAGEKGDKPKIYINGKEVTKEEMDKLKPEDIVTVNVNKTNNNGEERNEIIIQTK